MLQKIDIEQFYILQQLFCNRLNRFDLRVVKSAKDIHSFSTRLAAKQSQNTLGLVISALLTTANVRCTMTLRDCLVVELLD